MKTLGDGDTLGLRRPSVMFLGAILAVATVLRGIGLSRWSLWLDEIYTVSLRSQERIPELLFVSYDPHPPLYFVLVKGWTALTGTSPVAVRSLSLILSVGAVFGMFILGLKLFDTQTGVIAAAIFAVSTTQIHFGRNARMYPLLLLATVLSLYYFLDLRQGGKRTSGLYLLTTTVLLYTHIYGLFVVVGQNVLMLRRGGYLGAVSLRRWVGLQSLVGIAYLPWGLHLLDQVLTMLSDPGGQEIAVGWIPEPSLQLIRNSLLLYAGSPWELYPIVSGNPTTDTIATVILLVFGVAVLAALGSWDRDMEEFKQSDTRSWYRPEPRILAILFITVVGVPFLISYTIVPIYYPRFTVAATVPLVLLVAFGLRSIERKPVQIGLLAVLIGSSLFLTVTYYEGDSLEPWDAAVSVVESNTDTDDLVLLAPEYIPEFFDYYYDGTATITTASRAELETGTADPPVTGTASLEPGTRVCIFEYGETGVWQHLELPQGLTQIDSYHEGIIDVKCFERS